MEALMWACGTRIRWKMESFIFFKEDRLERLCCRMEFKCKSEK